MIKPYSMKKRSIHPYDLEKTHRFISSLNNKLYIMYLQLREQQEQGHGASDDLQKIIEEMNKQEIDLVNKRLDNEMLSRQQEILTCISY